MKCLPHQFQCGSQECLDPVLLCNGITNCADGSDEGGSCQINCSEDDNKRCSQSCHSTPQGTVRILCLHRLSCEIAVNLVNGWQQVYVGNFKKLSKAKAILYLRAFFIIFLKSGKV